jgi:hypothetical protein
MPDNNQPNNQEGNGPQNNPGTTGGGPRGTDGEGLGKTGVGNTGTGTSPAFDDETNAERGQAGQGGIQQEGAWRPSDDDSLTQGQTGGTEGTGERDAK